MREVKEETGIDLIEYDLSDLFGTATLITCL